MSLTTPTTTFLYRILVCPTSSPSAYSKEMVIIGPVSIHFFAINDKPTSATTSRTSHMQEMRYPLFVTIRGAAACGPPFPETAAGDEIGQASGRERVG